MLSSAEYIWLDGAQPTQELRSKTRVISFSPGKIVNLSSFPEWGFDGSSTYQATGKKSDLVLQPVNFVTDPLRGNGNYLVMCEVFSADGTPHITNARAALREELERGAAKSEPWFGFEQEYTLMRDGIPLGWPTSGYPAAQGPFYCGVGNTKVCGRELVEAHARACMDAGIMIYGTNAEVMLGQWEYQIGYRGIETESADPLNVADHLWLARWLMLRLGEDFDVTVSLDNKPVKGDWNGSGCHTNLSMKDMRDPRTGKQAIADFLEALSDRHQEHIAVYGDKLEERLTGFHETCDISTFKSGERDRGASIRIPDMVAKQGFGYLEDRRPGANCNPYLVAWRLLKTLNEMQPPASRAKKLKKNSDSPNPIDIA